MSNELNKDQAKVLTEKELEGIAGGGIGIKTGKKYIGGTYYQHYMRVVESDGYRGGLAGYIEPDYG